MFKQGYSLKRSNKHTHSYIHTYIHAGIRVKREEKAFENDKKKQKKGNQDSMIHVIKLSCLISSQIVVIQSD